MVKKGFRNVHWGVPADRGGRYVGSWILFGEPGRNRIRTGPEPDRNQTPSRISSDSIRPKYSGRIESGGQLGAQILFGQNILVE